MNKVKKVSILALMLAMALFFTGCTNGELKLYNAFLKSQEIRSMESEMNMEFVLVGEGLSDENQAILDEISTQLNDFKITVNQKSESNEDGTIAKGQIDAILDMKGIKTDMSVWVDADMSGKTLKMEQVIKMPKMFMDLAGEEFANKEYILYDYDEVLKMSGEEIDFTEIMDWSKEAQPKLTKILKNYVENFDLGFNMVESKGKRVVNREVFDIYEVKLNDEQFKDFVRYAGNRLMKNEDMIEFMKEYMELIFSIAGNQDENMKEELSKEMKKIEEELPKVSEAFDKFMDKLDGIKLLSEEGLLIEYAINEDGYIVAEKGHINFIVDLAAIGNQISELNAEGLEIPAMEGAIKLKLEFDSKISNINQDLKVEMPELNDSNTLKFSEMMGLGL